MLILQYIKFLEKNAISSYSQNLSNAHSTGKKTNQSKTNKPLKRKSGIIQIFITVN